MTSVGKLFKRRLAGAALAALFLTFSVPPALAVDSATLVEAADKYDGRAITFKGEVIGDVMTRRGGAWININDDPYSRQGRNFRLAGYNSGQSAFVPKSDARLIKITGSYTWRGDIVEVKGIFRKASSQHGGDMMIEGRSVRIIKKGFPLESPISRSKPVFAVVALILAASLAWLDHYLKAQRRRPRSE